MMRNMFSIAERCGQQAGQSSTRTLLLRKHAVVIAAVCGYFHCPAEIHIIWRGVYVALNPIYTVGTESIQTPLNFSLFVILQPFAKIKSSSFFSSLMYTQHPILTEKHRIVDIFADLLKRKTEISHGPKYSDPLL